MGISARRYLLTSWFFDDILSIWLTTNNIEVTAGISRRDPPLPQLIIESLACNGAMNLKQLIEKIGAKEEDIIRILNGYSIKPGNILKFNLRSQDKTDIRKKIYEDLGSRLLIYAHGNKTETTYELSIFGAMLAIALIRYCYGKKKEENYEKIALNYSKKLPLIFERWSLLKSHLGSLLYNSFDFLFFEKARSNTRDTSVWFGGIKEFYEATQSMAQNRHVYEKLLVMHAIGKGVMQKYEQYEDKIFPIRKKIAEIDGELLITQVLSSLGEKVPDRLQNLEITRDSLKTIEEKFVEEVSFFFYLNLNTIKILDDSISSKQGLPVNDLDFQDPHHNKILYIMNEMTRLGSPKQRLIAVLSKDNVIKQWFSQQVDDILRYHHQISKIMSDFSSEIAKPQEHGRKQKARMQGSYKKPLQSKPLYEEYDITKICSNIQLPYDY